MDTNTPPQRPTGGEDLNQFWTYASPAMVQTRAHPVTITTTAAAPRAPLPPAPAPPLYVHTYIPPASLFSGGVASPMARAPSDAPTTLRAQATPATTTQHKTRKGAEVLLFFVCVHLRLGLPLLPRLPLCPPPERVRLLLHLDRPLPGAGGPGQLLPHPIRLENKTSGSWKERRPKRRYRGMYTYHGKRGSRRHRRRPWNGEDFFFVYFREIGWDNRVQQ